MKASPYLIVAPVDQGYRLRIDKLIHVGGGWRVSVLSLTGPFGFSVEIGEKDAEEVISFLNLTRGLEQD